MELQWTLARDPALVDVVARGEARATSATGHCATVTVEATYLYNTLVPLLPLPAISVEAESTLVINN